MFVKHAGVKEAHVYETQRENVIVIHVEDQGKGFVLKSWTCHGPTEAVSDCSIRERLSLLGGSLAINSSPGNGTSAQVVIPVSGTGSARALYELNS